jgi:predicted ATPase
MLTENKEVFVGRKQQMEIAMELLAQAIEGKGATLFVSGEIGIGKTKFLDEIAARAVRQGAEIVVAKASCGAHAGIADAYLPFKMILREIVLENEKDQGKGKTKPFIKKALKVVYELAPDIAGFFFPPGTVAVKGAMYLFSGFSIQKKSTVVTGSLDQEKIFDQYTNALKKLSETSPLLIIVDDAHWADDASLSLLFHLARNTSSNKIFMVVAYRPSSSESHEHHRQQVDDLVPDLVRYGSHHIDLDWNKHTAEGQKGAEEFVKTYLSENYPNNVIAQQRVAQLTTELRSVLTCASIEGDEFTAEVVAKVKNLDQGQILSLLVDRLNKGHHLVDEKGEKMLGGAKVLSLFEFRHKLLRQHLYQNLSGAEKRMLHAKVGECLEVLYANRIDDVAPILAEHFSQAKAHSKAIYYLVLSASNNAKAFAYNDAIVNYEKALELLQMAQQPQGDQRLKILLELGNLHELTGDYAEATTYLEDSRQLAEQLNDKTSLGWALNSLADILREKGEYEKAETLYKECASLAEEVGDRGLILEISNDLAELYQHMDESLFVDESLDGDIAWEVSFKHADKVCKHAVLPEDAENLRRAYNTMGNLHMVHNHFDKAMRAYQHSLDIANKYKLKPVSLNNIGECYRLQGKLDDAKDYYEQYLDWTQRAHDRSGEATAWNNLAIVELERGRFDRCHECFDRSLELSQKFGYTECAVESLIMKGRALILQSRLTDAVGLFEEALRLNKLGAESGTAGEILFNVGKLFFSKGERSYAKWFLQQAIAAQSAAPWMNDANLLLDKC